MVARPQTDHIAWQLNALGAARLITERRVPHPGAAPTDHAGHLAGV